MDSWGRRPWGFRRWALLGGLLTLGVGPWARADLDGTSQARLSAVLSQQRTEALTLTWTQGRAEARLRRASRLRCDGRRDRNGSRCRGRRCG